VTGFPHLLAPGRIGTMAVRNRLVMSPMETMYGTPDGLPSARTRAYFAARAAGGVGLITVGATGIDHRHPETPGGLHIATDAAVEAHRALVDEVHAHGARIQPQIVHAGPDGLGPEMFGVESLGPSVIPSYLTGRPSRALEVEEVPALLDLYRAAGCRVREAGYDGLELHAAHGYMLLGSFLAPQRNRRTDDYRGDRPEGRVRLLLEVLAALRSELGADFPITLRVSGSERVAGGRTAHETAQLAPQLVAAGVDAFHVSGGVIDRYVTQMVNGAHAGDGLNVGAAAAVREVVDVPVIAVGRLHDPALAERVLAEGRADFVAMGRPLLADPDLPRKLRAGTPEQVRPCISCQNCIDAMELRFSVDCAVNARTGRERDLPDPYALGAADRSRAPADARPVVVVGGGPAGLEAARGAAAAGRRVVLLERSARLGGALAPSSVVHPGNAPFLNWIRAEVDRLGVDVRTGVDADPETVAALAPAAVVVATGGRLVAPDVVGSDLSHVRGPAAVRARLAATDAPALGRVVVVGGSLAGLQVAEHLARTGGPTRVSLVEPGPAIAPEVGGKRRTEQLDALDRLGVPVHAGMRIEEITPDGVVVVPAGGTVRTLPADEVWLVGTVAADPAVTASFAARLPGVPVVAAGDVAHPALVQGAVEQGARAAAGLRATVGAGDRGGS